MIQNVFVALALIVSVVFLCRLIAKKLSRKHTGCGTCALKQE